MNAGLTPALSAQFLALGEIKILPSLFATGAGAAATEATTTAAPETAATEAAPAAQ